MLHGVIENARRDYTSRFEIIPDRLPFPCVFGSQSKIDRRTYEIQIRFPMRETRGPFPGRVGFTPTPSLRTGVASCENSM